MIRRNVVDSRDNRVVKMALVAAAFALSLGFYAQRSLATSEAKATPAVAGQSVEAAPTNTSRAAS